MTLLFKMSEHTGFSLSEIENMIIWERDVYVSLKNIEVEKIKEKIKERKLRS